MLRTSLAAAFVVILAFPLVARAQSSDDARTPEQVVNHHWEAFTHRDLEAVLSDYADDAIFIAPNQTVQGKAALRQMFSKFLTGTASAQAPPSFEVKVTSDGDVGYEHWVSNAGKPNAMEGTDAFVVRHGKILFHTVVGVHPVAQK
ncbi:MAG TPA: nuclear transport factor 2 family protein [Verrucomicrobiae bacterium]|nr:nuclear transport factor 2 family protein [Verrucomicrobiae bacterium]